MTSSNSTARMITILDYIGFLCLLGLFIEKEDADVRFHTNQGLILFVFEIAAGILSLILGFIPLVGSLLRGLLGVLCLVYMILGILNAVNGQRRPLPVIGTLFTFIR